MTEEITEIVEETEVDEPMDEETKAALISITEQRSATYGLLSRLYRVEVDEEFLKEMKGMRFPAATGNTQVDEGYRLIATFLSNTWGNTITDWPA